MKSFDKILSELNTNRTLKIENTGGEISNLSDVHNFIIDNSIAEGKTAIPLKYIYATYVEQNRAPIKMNVFGNLFSKFFKKKHTGLGNYYSLEVEPFNLPEKYSFYKEYYNKKKYKYEKTKYRNIQSTPEGWMVKLDMQDGRRIFGFYKNEKTAAKFADLVALFFLGKTAKLNFKDSKRKYSPEDSTLLSVLTSKEIIDSDNNSEKEKDAL